MCCVWRVARAWRARLCCHTSGRCVPCLSTRACVSRRHCKPNPAPSRKRWYFVLECETITFISACISCRSCTQAAPAPCPDAVRQKAAERGLDAKALLEHPTKQRGETPLVLACVYGGTKCVEIQLEEGADFHAQSRHAKRRTHAACARTLRVVSRRVSGGGVAVCLSAHGAGGCGMCMLGKQW